MLTRGGYFLLVQADPSVYFRMQQRCHLLANHKHGICKKHFSVFPKVSEQWVINQVYNLAFSFFLDAKKQAVLKCYVAFKSRKTLYGLDICFEISNVPAAVEKGEPPFVCF